MLYQVRQSTSFSYASPVSNAHHALRMKPITGFEQSLVSFDLEITPEPIETSERRDFYGNDMTLITIEDPHDRMMVTARAEVEVERDRVFDELAPGWEQVQDEVVTSCDASSLAPAHFLFFSRKAQSDPTITLYAAESFKPGRSIVEAASDLTMRIHADFDYVPGATDVSTRSSDAFIDRKGVCQDFAHIMISGMRGMGLPAAYVSGYLRTVPPEGEQRLEGADATHAWIAVWCGEEMGWRGFDPTNAIVAGSDHVILAMGRDYDDVSPIDGVFIGIGDHTMSVSVDVVPL